MKRILAGPHAVSEALRATPGAVEVVCVVESMRPSAVRRIEDVARRANVPVETMPKSAVDKMARDMVHNGVIAVTGSYPYWSLEAIIDNAGKEKSPLLVILDQVQDPRNLGAVMRSAHAFGASGIIIPKDRAASVTAAVVRTSAGASELVRTARVTNLVRTIDGLKAEGYHIFGASVQATSDLCGVSWRGASALVMGSEGRGLRRLTAEHCDGLFKIPLVADFDSLNVSAAAAIVLYEAAKQRFV